MALTEAQEHAKTQKALDTLTKWGKNPNLDGGENIIFWLSRLGAPSDALLASGDCTPFKPSGKRGTLSGQPPSFTGEPSAMVFDPSTATLIDVPCTFSFNLNTGKVSISGAFPGLPASLSFHVEFFKKFDTAEGENILFCSDKASDHAGYVIAMQLVAAS